MWSGSGRSGMRNKINHQHLTYKGLINWKIIINLSLCIYTDSNLSLLVLRHDKVLPLVHFAFGDIFGIAFRQEMSIIIRRCFLLKPSVTL